MNYAYDTLGRLSSRRLEPSDRPYTYDDVGQLQEKLNGNGAYTTYAYDAAGDLIGEIVYTPGHRQLLVHLYVQPARQADLGNRRRRQHHHVQLDATDDRRRSARRQTIRPTSTTRPATARRSSTAHAHQLLRNADNEITGGSTTYAYERQRRPADHDRLQRHRQAYAYNDLGRLVSITDAAATSPVFPIRRATATLAGATVNG